MRKLLLTKRAHEVLDECVQRLENFPEIQKRVRTTRIIWKERNNALGWAQGRTISFSWEWFSQPFNTEGFVDVVRHEIAHIGAPGHGHDRVWRSLYHFLGGKAKRGRFKDIRQLKRRGVLYVFWEIYKEIHALPFADGLRLAKTITAIPFRDLIDPHLENLA